MLALFTDAASSIMAILGETATYTALSPSGTIALSAIVRRDISTPVAGAEGLVLERRTMIYVLSSAMVGRVPAIGDTVTVGAETWKVLAIEEDNGYFITLRARVS